MITTDINMPTVYLKPGELYMSDKPTQISTVLGSCVSVTMYNRRLKIGGICHAVMPTAGLIAKKSNNYPVNCMQCTSTKDSFKYVDCAISYMIKKFAIYGILPIEIEVKMFGGAAMIASKHRPGVTSIGDQNINAAMYAIEAGGLTLRSSNTGNMSGRKIMFYTHTGEILLKHLNNTFNKHYLRASISKQTNQDDEYYY